MGVRKSIRVTLAAENLTGHAKGAVMEPLGQARPGVEQRAEQAVESACHLADTAGPGAWNTAAAEDALDAIDTLAEALGTIGPEIAEALAAVAAATTQARRRLEISVDAEPETTAPVVPIAPRTASRPRRRGLGPGFQGVRTGL